MLRCDRIPREVRQLTIDVAFVPPVNVKGIDDVYVVIDVIRASSTITMLFDKGCRELLLTDNVDAYIGENRAKDDTLAVCAESVAGYCLEGADFSPSLLELEPLQGLEGKTVLMQTTNGTVAAHTLISAGKGNILIGSMRNAKAVMDYAAALAKRLGVNLHIVCAGREAGTSYTIDDTYCAAFLVNKAAESARTLGLELVQNDSAKLALMTHAVYPNAEEAFAASASGNTMRKINRPEDIGLCAVADVSTAVPRFTGHTPEGHLRFENRAGHPADIGTEA